MTILFCNHSDLPNVKPIGFHPRHLWIASQNQKDSE
jgi:hypothetical protein